MTVAKEWTNQLPKSPLAELQITTLLMPLLKQYLRLSLAQESTEEPIKDLTVVIKTISKITRSINAHEKGTTL